MRGFVECVEELSCVWLLFPSGFVRDAFGIFLLRRARIFVCSLNFLLLCDNGSYKLLFGLLPNYCVFSVASEHGSSAEIWWN